jgi:hypothetical protein
LDATVGVDEFRADDSNVRFVEVSGYGCPVGVDDGVVVEEDEMVGGGVACANVAGGREACVDF